VHGSAALEHLRKRALEEENELAADDLPTKKCKTRSQTGSKSTDFTTLFFL